MNFRIGPLAFVHRTSAGQLLASCALRAMQDADGTDLRLVGCCRESAGFRVRPHPIQPVREPDFPTTCLCSLFPAIPNLGQFIRRCRAGRTEKIRAICVIRGCHAGKSGIAPLFRNRFHETRPLCYNCAALTPYLRMKRMSASPSPSPCAWPACPEGCALSVGREMALSPCFCLP